MKTRSPIMLTLCAIALSLGLAAAPAAADEPSRSGNAGNATAPASSSKAKIKTLVFGEGSDVEGAVVGPDGETVGVAGPLIHSNLIRVRQHFIPEIFKSAENL